MHYLTFASPESTHYPIALLSKTLRRSDLKEYVVGIESEVVAYSLPMEKTQKNADIQAYLEKLLPVLCQLRTDYLLVTDAAYFKYLTKVKQADRFAGYVLPCKLENYEHFHVIYLPNAGAMLYNPNLVLKLDQGLKALQSHRDGTYRDPGKNIIKFEAYPHKVRDIADWLERLVDTPLSIDIEAYSLKHYDAGIGTITMCWSENEGIAFAVDKDHTQKDAEDIRALLKAFFEARAAKTLYHRAWYDVYVLVYQLFMKDTLDTEGLLYGLSVMFRNWEDTQLIRYLATNSCAGNKLSLKDVAQEFAGNYAVEVKDITVVPLPLLLNYNLVDGLSTWYAHNKHYDQVIADDQLDIYENLFKPVMWDIVQMQLTGLPMDMNAVLAGELILEKDQDAALDVIMASPYVAQMNVFIADTWAVKRNQELKVKRVTPAECPDKFNPNSNEQLQHLLHNLIGLPVIDLTETKQPATGMDSLEKLLFHVPNQDAKDLLQALIGYKKVNKILTSFIPAFKKAHLAPDGWHYLYGNFNLAGTLSGRLSSSDPNLQNLPATGTEYAKLIKQMFRAKDGTLFCGIDFNSLEDMISALTTKDPNKLKVYTDGYDGHSLRAYSYFTEDMPDIDPNSVASINSIQDKYKPFRQDSKGPTFALTYQGTWRTLVENCGFSEEKAKQITDRYHELYAVSDKWVQDRLAQAAKDGYVTLAFGLRLRTPALKKSILNTRSTPYAATAEGRTAGNALGQSYCMLNSRAGMEFNQRVRASKYRLRVRPCAQIHDAQYFLIDDDIEVLHWVNINLVECVQWQDLPEIQHPTVKLGGSLSIFYPHWGKELSIPNLATEQEILTLAKEHYKNVTKS